MADSNYMTESNGQHAATIDSDKSIQTQMLDMMRPKTLNEAMQFCQMVADSSLVPAQYKGKPGDIMIAWQTGIELGITSCLQAIQNIAVINGRPSVWGDMMLAICRASAAWDETAFSETLSGQGMGMTATCTVARKGGNVNTVTFSMEDAKQAGLSGKSGPWQQYPKRMLQMRARGYALRDTFTPELKGVRLAEEEHDITPEKEGKGSTTNDTSKQDAGNQRKGTASRAGGRLKDAAKKRRGEVYDNEPTDSTSSPASEAVTQPKADEAPADNQASAPVEEEKPSYNYAQAAEAIQSAQNQEDMNQAGRMMTFFNGSNEDLEELRSVYMDKLHELGLSKKSRAAKTSGN